MSPSAALPLDHGELPPWTIADRAGSDHSQSVAKAER
jgi:hypothetical protein